MGMRALDSALKERRFRTVYIRSFYERLSVMGNCFLNIACKDLTRTDPRGCNSASHETDCRPGCVVL